MLNRRRLLQVALVVTGLASILLYPLMRLWPSGWAWLPGQPEYELMMVGIYATLGVFLVIAARNPEAHLSLIWFTVCSSVVHGGIMGVQAFVDSTEHGHLVADVPALFIIAAALAALAPRQSTSRIGQADSLSRDTGSSLAGSEVG
jgi:hypothetical protein